MMNAPAPTSALMRCGWNEPTNSHTILNQEYLVIPTNPRQPAIPAALARPCWLLMAQLLPRRFWVIILGLVCFGYRREMHHGLSCRTPDTFFQPHTAQINTTFKLIIPNLKTRAWACSFSKGVLVCKCLVSIHDVRETPLVLKAAILEPNGSKFETFTIVVNRLFHGKYP